MSESTTLRGTVRTRRDHRSSLDDRTMTNHPTTTPTFDDSSSVSSGTDRTGSGASAEDTHGYVRSPQDALRLVFFAVVSIGSVAVTIGLEDGVLGLEEDIVELFGFLSPSIERVLNGGVEVVAGVVGLTAIVLPLVVRRFRLAGYIASASLAALAVMSLVQWIVDRETAPGLLNELAQRAGIANTGTTSGAVGLAQLTAMFVAFAPFTTRRWRQAGAGFVFALLIVRLLVTVRLPVEVFVAIPIGALCGSAVLFAFGRPDRRPTLEAVRAALGNAGLVATDLHVASVDARASMPYFATLADGSNVFIKVLGAQERAADLLFRSYRSARFKNIGDDRLFSSLRRTIEHEALIALLARDSGIRTPRLRGIVSVGADSMLLAYEAIDGRSLDDVPADEITDDLLRGVWEQVELLRTNRIAHRDLRRSNVVVGRDAMPWLIDFGFAEAAVPATILDADMAQMLVSLAVVVGPERSVASAVDVLGKQAVGGALPRLQNKALSSATQQAVKRSAMSLDDLRDEVSRQTGVGDVELVELERISRSMIITVVALVLATYFLFPQLADLPGIVDQIQDANWAWTPLIILASVATYVGATMSLAGSVPPRLPGGPLFFASVGSSFAGTLAPASVGGMALNLRFFQKQGVERSVAVSGVGLDAIGGVIGHVSLIGVFFLWGGRDAFGSFSLPDPEWFLLGFGIVVGLGLLAMAVPATRRLVRERLLVGVSHAFDGITDVLRSPSKVTLLLGGSTLVTLAYLLTCWFSIEAFGGGLPFATVGAVFLVALAVATAAPTPGGLGAMEAALIGGLVAAGLDNTVAVPAVFLYRLFTFWVPILPGWFAFQWLQRNDYL